jgi:diguanylate cyclase (GGDEF)-like protein
MTPNRMSSPRQRIGSPSDLAAKRASLLGGAVAAGVTAYGALFDPVLAGVGVGLAGATAGLAGARTARVMRRRVQALEAQVRDQSVATEAQLASLAALSSELRLDKALDQITASASGAIGGAQFALLVNESGRMRADRCSEIPQEFVDRLERWANEHQHELVAGPVVLGSLERVPDLSSLPGDESVALGSACAAPLMFAEQLLGALVALAPGALVFLPSDVRALEIYAGHAAIALWNARLVEQLEREAAQDPLTGLANRRVLGLACAAETDRAAREDGSVALVMLDVDHFKLINDTYGHPFGDEVLVRAAGLLRSVVRGHDTVARVGGEEFALLLPGAAVDEAREVAERARGLLAAIEMPHGTLSCSAGVAVTSGSDAPSSDLFGAADGALYEAKRQGRGRTVVAAVAQLQP